MKLLFDQNISHRIVKQVAEKFPESSQVRFEGLEDSSDGDIFHYARERNFAIVTFDSDFVDLNLLKGAPPKAIFLKTGNLTTRHIAELINYQVEVIKLFLADDSSELLLLDKKTSQH